MPLPRSIRQRSATVFKGLPYDIIRKITRMVGEVSITQYWESEHDLASLVLLRGRGEVVLVPRQLYVVSKWHTWFALTTWRERGASRLRLPGLLEKRRTVTPVTKVERFGRDGGYCVRRLRLKHPIGNHCNDKSAASVSVVYHAGFMEVPWSGDVIMSKRRGMIEPFHFIID